LTGVFILLFFEIPKYQKVLTKIIEKSKKIFLFIIIKKQSIFDTGTSK
jgi:hypothetical protein